MILPSSTYRLQFRDGMTFERAAALVPHIKALGISHLYASPIFTATAGSTHGYDVTDCNELDPSLGGMEGFEKLCDALDAAGLGMLVDIVPNHMAASLENRWWRSVVEWGEDSLYPHFFDIDWKQRLTLPILGKPLAEAIEAGEIALKADAEMGSLVVAYYDNKVPLHPATYAEALGAFENDAVGDLIRLAQDASAAEEEAFHEAMRAQLQKPEVRDEVQRRLDALCEDRGALKELLDEQAYELMFWKEAATRLSYRRFFEVTGLVGLRVEDEEVFEASHRLILDLVHKGKVQGIRLDHIDGLADPKQYLDRLRQAVGPDVYVVVEKILEEDEVLPESWPIQGTTGYEFISCMPDVFVDAGGVQLLDEAYTRLSPPVPDFEKGVKDAKLSMAEKNFAGETARLVDLLVAITKQGQHEIERQVLHETLVSILCTFPVYRTYGTRNEVPTQSVAIWSEVLGKVRNTGGADNAALDFIDRVFLEEVLPEALPHALSFRLRLQQLTGPLMAKSVEDTVFYRYNRLIALNEVGGNPDAQDWSLGAFHTKMVERAKTQPFGLSATSTHDTKRGEDARARLYAISEAPELWIDAVSRWSQMNKENTREVDGSPTPDPALEWMLYQALAGVWPSEADKPGALDGLEARFTAYLEKALREAKLQTNWGSENEAYEAAVLDYARKLLSPNNPAFRTDFSRTLRPFIRAGFFNSLTQTVLKLTAPGIPDIYQGTEGFDFSLVDPDNRRLPDYAHLSSKDNLGVLPFDEGALQDGRAKGAVLSRLLHLRQKEPEVFNRGGYEKVMIEGAAEGHAVAFQRQHEKTKLLVIVPRLLFSLKPEEAPVGDYWRDTRLVLPDHDHVSFTNVLTDEKKAPEQVAELSKVLSDFPVAVLLGKQ